MSTCIADVRQSTATDRHTLAVCHLGHLSYADAWKIQRDVQDLLIRAKRQGSEYPVPNFLFTLEHPPVYTLGKSGDKNNLLLPEEALAREGISFVHTDRGGDITYHGPGQLVVYPILDLDRFFTDIGRYLRLLEDVVIAVCASYGLSGGRVAGRTGVWLDFDSGNERKICALGIRCSRWVTMHGLALNVNTKLDHYDHIVPCGISDRGVTSLAKELGHSIDPTDCRNRLVEAFAEKFAAPFFEIESADLDEFLVGTTVGILTEKQ